MSPQTLPEPSEVVEVLQEKGFLLIPGLSRTDLTAFAPRLGDLLPVHGKIWFDVKPKAGFQDKYAAVGMTSLHPHLDKYEWPEPPDLVGLYCVNPDQTGGGSTAVCDMRPFLSALPFSLQQKLQEKTFRFVADEGLQAQGIMDTTQRPVWDFTNPSRPRFRFSYNYTRVPEGEAEIKDFLRETRNWFNENCTNFLLQAGDLLLLKNEEVLHARHPIRDPERHLIRFYLRNTG